MRTEKTRPMNMPETEIGKKWRPRLLASERYYSDYSSKWEYHRGLFRNVMDAFKENRVWSNTIALGWALMHAIVDDTYIQNPETMIEARVGNPELSMTLRQVTNTVHEDADTEEIMRQAITTTTWAGFAGHWMWMDQEEDEFGDAISQQIKAEYVSPYCIRFDPFGRKWDLSDHKWLARKFKMSGKAIENFPYFTEDGVRATLEWAKAATQAQGNAVVSDVHAGTVENYEEDDPLYYDIEIYEIWSGVEHQRIWIPVIGNAPAPFELGVRPFPKAFQKRQNLYPLTFVAFNREPENEKGTEGFIPKPDISLIADNLENIMRLNDLWVDAASISVLKYFYMQGIFGTDEEAVQKKVTTDKTREMIPVDISTLTKNLVDLGVPAAQLDPTKINLRDWIMLLPTEERTHLAKHEEAIRFQLDIISNILAMGPLSRFGIAESDSATESAGIQEGKADRQQVRVNAAGRIYDRVSEKIWLILKSQATLPVIYRSSTSKYEEGIWREFNAQDVWGMELSFRHRVGSNKPRDPQTEQFLRKEVATVALPILQANQDTEKIDEIMRWWLEAYDFPGLRVFESKAKQIAMELAKLKFGIMDGSVQPTPEVAAKKGDLESQLLMAVLGPKGMEMVAQSLSEGGPGLPTGAGGAQGEGSLPAAQTPGQRAFAAGSAGAALSAVGGG